VATSQKSRARALKAPVKPEILVRALVRRFSIGSFEFRLALDAVDRPWYGHGIYEAAKLASLLNEKEISVIEFGVAGGGGLIAMENLATQVETATGVKVRVFGFDSGQGLPTHSDYRDLPCIWRKTFYSMDVQSLQSKLQRAQLILAEVSKTVPHFLESGDFTAIGFVSFDLDYYSSTREAFRLFEMPDAKCLPRVLCYFDDIMSGDQQYSCEDVGELLAIREFNEHAARNHRIRPIHGWKRSLLLEPEWADAMWAYHRFDHCRYNEYIGRRHDSRVTDSK
jgi:hypothetical protein